MIIRIVTLLLLLCSIITAQQDRGFKANQLPAQESRIALVIGNGNYPKAPLRNAVNDARAMASALSSLGFEVMPIRDGTQKEMREAIRAFGQRISHGGVGLFYYAGHGMQLNDKNFLIPIDAVIEKELDIENEGVELNRVMTEMASAQNSLNVVILDACRDNPFARGFRSYAQGLAQAEAPSGVLIAYATAPGSVAADGEGSNGLYTQELLAAIRQPGLKIEEVLKVVRRQVKRKSNDKQTPWESSSLTGDFYFNPGQRPVGPKQEAPTIPVQNNLDRWGLQTPCWVICASACKTETEARKRKAQFCDRGYQTGYLWIPDYSSLSGAQMFLIYLGPYQSREDVKYALAEYKKTNAGAYALLVANKPGRVEIR